MPLQTGSKTLYGATDSPTSHRGAPARLEPRRSILLWAKRTDHLSACRSNGLSPQAALTPLMGKSDEYKDFVLDQLADLHGLTCRAMFGGHGLSFRELSSASSTEAGSTSKLIRPPYLSIVPKR